MKVQENRIVEIKYTLRKEGPNGEILEVMDEQWPFKFLFGAGVLLPAFEQHLKSLEERHPFSFTLTAEEAYGEPDPKKVAQVFKDEIVEDHRYPLDNYEEGDLINLTLANGKTISGKISEIKDDYILVDGNHVMAGFDLQFEGQVLNVRKARTDELIHKRYIEPNGIRSDSRLSEPPNE